MRTNHIFREKTWKISETSCKSVLSYINHGKLIHRPSVICHTRYMHIFCSYWFHHWWWCYLIGYYQCNDHVLYKQSWCWFLWCRRRLMWIHFFWTGFMISLQIFWSWTNIELIVNGLEMEILCVQFSRLQNIAIQTNFNVRS